MDVRVSVQDRYGEGAQAREAALCCPIDYEPKYLEVIPEEVIERDYGCGDPSRYARKGDTVLDLGSGGGKICFIASQIVGATGLVIGVDMTDDMLALARGHAPTVAAAIGYSNITFKRGHIEDLRTDLDLLETYLQAHPVQDVAGLEALEAEKERLGRESPLIADGSVDLIVSNCVLNLVSDGKKKQLFAEMYRVLKRGGRIAISDIVSDEISPQHLKDDPKLWSGCVSGALQESEFLSALAEAGFHGITIDKFDDEPWQIVEGIEYRSMTVLAYKGKKGPCIEKNDAVIYKGPWSKVEDDDGHIFVRGERMAVCEKTARLMAQEPYADQMIPIPSALVVTEDAEFDCGRDRVRSPQETKRGVPKVTTDPSQGSCC